MQIGREFAYWLGFGFVALAIICLAFAPLNYIQDWLDAKRETDRLPTLEDLRKRSKRL